MWFEVLVVVLLLLILVLSSTALYFSLKGMQLAVQLTKALLDYESFMKTVHREHKQ